MRAARPSGQLTRFPPQAPPMTTPTTLYAHRARPYAAEAEFELMPTHVAVRQGRRSGDFPYRDIVMIRLTYKPRNSTNEGYQTKIYRRDKRTASLTNISWKSLVELDRMDAGYRGFVEALVQRTSEANPNVVLVAGMPGWQHKLTVLAGLIAVLALITVTSQALLNRGYPVAFFAGALAVYFVWFTLRFTGRNRPRGFSPDAIPQDVLPKT
jgi:hypothetical protein